MKIYKIQTIYGDYHVIAFNESHDKIKAYKIYKKSRNGDYRISTIILK
ncbi:MAG TPA: hypothetical protein GXZ90_09090 [Clostridiales bacterium]|nr:hypothetical protein [Clostridiales bacterium]